MWRVGWLYLWCTDLILHCVLGTVYSAVPRSLIVPSVIYFVESTANPDWLAADEATPGTHTGNSFCMLNCVNLLCTCLSVRLLHI